MKQITKLSAEQIARLDDWRERWLRVGLCTDPADRAGAQEGIIAAYKADNLEAPALFVWLRSPLEGTIGSWLLSQSDQVGDQVWAQVGDQVRDQVWAQVRDQVGDQVRDQVRDQVWDQVRAQVRAQNICWGQHDAGWLSWIDYFRVVTALACAERASGLIHVAECCGWWWPNRGAVVLTERPVYLSRDGWGRLHSEDRAAIEYPDGWGVYVWHGVRVPSSVILEREKLTVAQIVSEKNTEVRRVMRNLYGNERFMRDAGAQEISRSEKHGCRLLRLHLPGDPVEIKMAELVCPSTGSVYYERVPPDVMDALEALSWRFGVKPKEYEPIWES